MVVGVDNCNVADTCRRKGYVQILGLLLSNCYRSRPLLCFVVEIDNLRVFVVRLINVCHEWCTVGSNGYLNIGVVGNGEAQRKDVASDGCPLTVYIGFQR